MERREQGYALAAFLIFLAVGLFVIANALGLVNTSLRTNYAAHVRSDRFFETDRSIGLVLNWFRVESQNMITPFTRTNFYSRFDRSTPSVGANDVSVLSIPTRVKIRGTSDSVLLSSTNALGTQAFPNSQNIVTNASYDATTSFRAGAFGQNIVRATLVDAIPVDASLNFGPPPNPAPQTDFYPVYRIDVLTAVDQGAHLLGYMVGTMSYVDTVGFYGRDFVDALQSCDSYISSNGPYGPGNRRAHCPVGSNGPVRVHQNERIYGSIRTNGTIVTTSPYGGGACADFTCTNQGQTCQGASCAVPGLPTFSSWTTYCPTSQGNRNVSTNQTWTVAGSLPSQRCWDTVTLANNRTLTLTSTGPNNAYFIRTLNLPNNGSLNIAPNPTSGTVYLYVETISGNRFNGNQVVNLNNRPSQFRLYYLGTNALTLNGTAAMNVALVSPNAGVVVSGNFSFNGGILATNLSMQGNSTLHYDESLGGSTLTDINYRLRDKIQYYN